MTTTLFVTGTDTEVGKTAASCALLENARDLGLETAAVKPVAAGCDADGRNEDALQLMASMTRTLAYEQVNPVALAEPIAPHLAARHEGVKLQVSQLAGLCRSVMAGGADLVLIEGAGGWRVPLNPTETLADLARELDVGVILVVGMRLGCINHALLTAEAIRADGLRLVGWVANQCGPRMGAHEENLDTMRDLLHAPLLGELPHISPLCPRSASQYLDLKALFSK